MNQTTSTLIKPPSCPKNQNQLSIGFQGMTKQTCWYTVGLNDMKLVSFIGSLLAGAIVYKFLLPHLGVPALLVGGLTAFVLQPILYHTLCGLFGSGSNEDNSQ